MMVIRACAITVTLFISGIAAAQEPPRDTGKAAAWTATISGVVVLDDADGRPVRRARVTLTSAELQIGQTAISEDDGTFTFRGLPGGRYMLTPIKEGYDSIAYGAIRPSRPGAALVVADGETRRVTLHLARGSVIAGGIANIDGTPGSGVAVRAMRYSFIAGERQLIPAGNQAISDDRGMFRIYGLVAGDYIVSASSRNGLLALSDIHPMTENDMRAALDELRGGTVSPQPRPGMPDGTENGAATDSPRTFGYAAVYYPGTTVLSEAAVIAVVQGEERAGVDFQLQLVPMARVSGTVRNGDGTPPPAATAVTLIANAPAAAMMESLRVTRADGDGKFTFTGVAPGRYVVSSRASARGPASPAAASAMPDVGALWASADLSVDGIDVTDLTLTLQRGLTLAGRLAFEGATTPPKDLTRARVTLQPVQSGGEMTLTVMPARVGADGHFTMNGVTPGRYRLTAALVAGQADASGWMLKSSVIDTGDALDVPFDIRQSVEDAVITFTDRTTEIAGVVRDESGNASPACFVVIAPADPAAWQAQSRRITAIRPTADGKYAIRNMPAGEYLIEALGDVEQGEWFDRVFLQRFANAAARIALGDGEHKTIDLRLTR
jgi:hypothetical protein